MEERDNTNENIVYPLPYGLKTFITRELSKITQDIDESITIIENTVKENNNLYVSLIQNLHDILKDDTKPFVNKIIQYKKRICRDGVTCKRGINCIFNHPTKTYEPFNKTKPYEPFNKTKPYEPFNKTKTYEPYNKTKTYENYSKRPRFTDNTELNEIILNNVPLHITDDEVKNYCDQFGFCTVKRLKENKFLISYKTNEGAKGLLYAKETMFNDDGVKKYFNRNTKVQEDDLEQLFEDLDYQINYVRNETNHEGFKKMNWIMNRIKSIVLKKTNVREKKSLLCNSNFVME